MSRTSISSHIDAFRTEILMLLRYQIASDKLKNDFAESLRTNSSFVCGNTLVAIKAIENDMVIRLAKLDDNSKGVHSLPNLEKELKKSGKLTPIIEKLIQNFSDSFQGIKRIRRHTQLAHLKVGSIDDSYDPMYNFKELLLLLIDVIDTVNGSEISYNWSDFGHQYDMVKKLRDFKLSQSS